MQYTMAHDILAVCVHEITTIKAYIAPPHLVTYWSTSVALPATSARV